MIIGEIIDQIRFEVGDNERQYPANFYIQSINEAIEDIYSWLLKKQLYTNIKTQEINTIAGKENYSKERGKTLSIKNGLQELELVNVRERDFFHYTGIPQKYCEILTEILLIPIPNAVYKLMRDYIFYPQINSIIDDFVFPNDFVRITVLMSASKTVNLYNKDEKWLKQRSQFLIKWQEEIEQQKDKLYSLYSNSIREKPINYFLE